MSTRSTRAVMALSGLLAAGAAWAADDYASLLRSRRFEAVEAMADARLARDPADADALAAKAEAILAAGPAQRTDEAVGLAKHCVDANPRQSGCYLALGNALGAKARSAHAMAAMRYAERIRDAFATAVELDPGNTDARFALLDYYMHAPAIVGGGKGRARALAEQTGAVNPAAAALMRAQLQLAAGDADQAEATLLSVQPGSDGMVADRQRDLLAELAQRYQSERRYADSERISQIAHQRFSR